MTRTADDFAPALERFYPHQNDHPFDAFLPPKSLGAAYAFMMLGLVGVFGIQHFYLGRPVRGTIYLLTFGVLGLGTLVDLITLRWQVRDINMRHAIGVR
jgi:TM2 domain-containing membrane protein YozV